MNKRFTFSYVMSLIICVLAIRVVWGQENRRVLIQDLHDQLTNAVRNDWVLEEATLETWAYTEDNLAWYFLTLTALTQGTYRIHMNFDDHGTNLFSDLTARVCDAADDNGTISSDFSVTLLPTNMNRPGEARSGGNIKLYENYTLRLAWPTFMLDQRPVVTGKVLSVEKVSSSCVME